MSHSSYDSWGRYPTASQTAIPVDSVRSPLPTSPPPVLPYGNGRSYGDSCLNDGGVLIPTTEIQKIVEFDSEEGLLVCESGTLISAIHDLTIPDGWQLPVTPGTQLITVGGAIANDVHGKNHHRAGTFGCHVAGFDVHRSDGQVVHCSEDENQDLYRATIGGLGLTGLITLVRLRLRKISSPIVQTSSIPFNSLSEYMELAHWADRTFEYTAAWIDCSSGSKELGRGILFCGNQSSSDTNLRAKPRPSRIKLSVPFAPPFSLVNNFSVSAFNRLYFARQRRQPDANKDFREFLYPLDSIGRWNRIYGRQGFLQHQSVVPLNDATERLGSMLGEIRKARSGSFLAVLKTFGHMKSPGMMSFPRPGVTLALDFPIRKDVTFDLLDRLDEIVRNVGGAIYPAKDARMSHETFVSSFPLWEEFAERIDPSFSSSFWRRVTNKRP